MASDDPKARVTRAVASGMLMHFMKDVDAETLAMTTVYAHGGGLRSGTIMDAGKSLRKAHELLADAAARVAQLIMRNLEDTVMTLPSLGDDKRRRSIWITEAEDNALHAVVGFARAFSSIVEDKAKFWDHYGATIERFLERELSEDGTS